MVVAAAAADAGGERGFRFHARSPTYGVAAGVVHEALPMDAARRKRTGAPAQDAWRPQRFHAAAARYQGAVIHAAAVRGAVSGAGSAGEIRAANGAAAVGGCHRRRGWFRSAVGPQQRFLLLGAARASPGSCLSHQATYRSACFYAG